MSFIKVCKPAINAMLNGIYTVTFKVLAVVVGIAGNIIGWLLLGIPFGCIQTDGEKAENIAKEILSQLSDMFSWLFYIFGCKYNSFVDTTKEQVETFRVK